MSARQTVTLVALAALVSSPAGARPEFARPGAKPPGAKGSGAMGSGAKGSGAMGSGAMGSGAMGSGAMGHGGMYGQPLYQTGMKQGTLTVKVIRDGALSNVVVGTAVELRELAGAAAREVAVAHTDDNGRATFSAKLIHGKRYRAVLPAAKGNPTEISSPPFNAPKEGGVRMLLSLGAGAAAASDGATSDGATGAGGRAPTSAPVKPGQKTQAGAAELEAAPEAGDRTVKVIVSKGNKPVVGAKLVLSGAPARLKARTDASGEATFELPEAAKVFTVSVQHAGLDYASSRVTRPDKGGLRLSFAVYQPTKQTSILRFGPGTHLIARVVEGRVTFRQVLVLLNTSRTELFDPGEGLELPLPAGAEGVNLARADQRFVTIDPQRRRLLLTGPVPPGQLTLQYTYSLLYKGPSLELRHSLPIAATRRVMVLINGERLTGHGPSIAASRVEKMADTKARIFELREAAANSTVELTLGGLPSHDQRGTTAALALAGVLLLWGLLASLGGDRPTRRRREALLEALAALERGKGKADPARYAEQRERLLDELRQVWRPTPPAPIGDGQRGDGQMGDGQMGDGQMGDGQRGDGG